MSHVVGKLIGGGGGGSPAPVAEAPKPDHVAASPKDRAYQLGQRSEQMRSQASDEGITVTGNDQDQLGKNKIPMPMQRKASARLLGG